MVPVPNVYGVESFKEIKPEMVALHPIQHKDTNFTSSGTNRISFKIPAYSNALLDTSRSFLHMQLSSAAPSVNDSTVLAQGLPIFERMVVKTSSGLTIEDVSDMDILSHMLSFVKPTEWEKASVYGNRTERVDGTVSNVGLLNANTDHSLLVRNEVVMKFDWGIFDKKLSKFIPLFMADGGAGYSFDVDLYVSNRGTAVNTDSDVLGTAVMGAIQIERPVWYLQLMRMDEGLARRFNQMAVSGEEIRIPFHTYHTHNASGQSDDQIVYIHENATNFKKIITCLHKSGQPLIRYDTTSQLVQHNGMAGGGSQIGAGYPKVDAYNYRIGVQNVYNEPVAEKGGSNTRSLQFVKQAFGIPDEMTTGMEITVADGEVSGPRSRVFDRFRWMSVASFDYSPSDTDVVQGISSSNPVQLDIKFSSSPSGFNILNFCELGYDLVFRGGAVHYEEQKPGSQSVY
jgi:hypothetical protein